MTRRMKCGPSAPERLQFLSRCGRAPDGTTFECCPLLPRGHEERFTMKLRTLAAAAPALAGALFLSGCYYSHRTEGPPPAYPPSAAAPASCTFAGQGRTLGARLVTPGPRNMESGLRGS